MEAIGAQERAWFSPPGISDHIRLRYGFFAHEGKHLGSVVLQGGRTEFIEKHAENIRALCQRGYNVWSMDWRGQGLSTRSLGDPHKGHVGRFSTYLADFHHFLQDIVAPKTGRPSLIMGHSMGGHLLLRYLYRYPAATDKAILIAPMTKINTGPVPEKVVLSLVKNACRMGLVREYAPAQGPHGVRDEDFALNRLTSDPVRFREALAPIANEPALALGGITYGWLRAAILSMQRARRKNYLKRVLTPMLLVSAVQDKVVDSRDHVRVARRLPDCELHRIHEAEHEVLHENDLVRRSFWRAFEQFTRDS